MIECQVCKSSFRYIVRVDERPVCLICYESQRDSSKTELDIFKQLQDKYDKYLEVEKWKRSPG